MARKAPKAAPVPTADAGTELIEKYEPVEGPDANAPVEPVEEVPVTETPAPPPPKPAHPSYLTRAAKQVGFDDDEIAGYTTAELKEAVNIVAMTRQQDVKLRDAELSRQRDESGRFVKEAPEPDAPFTLKDVGIDPADWNEETVGIMTKALAPMMAQIKELKSELGSVKAREQHRETNSALDQLDKLFSQNEAVFGVGSREDLDAESPEKVRRNAVIREMAAIPPNQRTTMKKDFAKVSKAMFGTLAPPKPVEPVEEETPDPKGFLNGHTIVPTARVTKAEPKGVRLAEQNLAARLKQRATVAVDTTEFDELPD